MTKSRDEVKKEIYLFIEEIYLETGKSVILQKVHDQFCKRYNISTATVTRMLDELVQRKSPFRLVTWYDKNRYYCIRTISLKTQIYVALTFVVPMVVFFVCLVGVFSFDILKLTAASIIGFWFSQFLMYLSATRQKKNNKD